MRKAERLACCLRAHRAAARLTQLELAQRAGISRSEVSALERAQVPRAGEDVWNSVAQAFHHPDADAMLAAYEGRAVVPLPSRDPEAALEELAEAVLDRLLRRLDLPRRPPGEQQQLRQLLGDKAEADVAGPLPGVPARTHGGHSTRRRVNPELAAA